MLLFVSFRDFECDNGEEPPLDEEEEDEEFEEVDDFLGFLPADSLVFGAGAGFVVFFRGRYL